MKQYTIGLALIFSCVSSTLFATLGENAASTTLVSRSLKTQIIARSNAQYTVHEMTAVGGTVREYIATNGKVFAVTWQGPLPQDLTLLLGRYFDAYDTQLQAAPKSRSRTPLALKADDLVVLKSGHMRDMRGKAFLKSRLPIDVRGEDLP